MNTQQTTPRLFGQARIQRSNRIARDARQRVDPETGRLPAPRVNEIYEQLAQDHGVSIQAVREAIPSELKPTPAETLQYGRTRLALKRLQNRFRPARPDEPTPPDRCPATKPAEPAAPRPAPGPPDEAQKKPPAFRKERGSLRERQKALVDARGELVDYDLDYIHRPNEERTTQLDPSSRSTLDEIRSRTAQEFIDELQRITALLPRLKTATERALNEYDTVPVRMFEPIRDRILNAIGPTHAELVSEHEAARKELRELEEYQELLEAELESATQQIQALRATLRRVSEDAAAAA